MREQLRQQRETQGFTIEELAHEMRVAPSTVWRWEHGRSTPLPGQRPRLARLLDLELDELAPLLDPPRATATANTGREATAEDELAQLHEDIRHVIALDSQHGGDDVVDIAGRLFRVAQARLAAREYPASYEHDFAAVAGEAGQVAAWVAYDAGQLTRSRRFLEQARLSTRLAGDRPMELFQLDHLMMQATYEHRPADTLRVAQELLDEVTGRTAAIFTIRRGRARAQTGDRRRALEDLGRARALVADGITTSDPAWTWWVDEAELAFHEAGALSDLGDWTAACDRYSEAWRLRGGRDTPSWRPWSTRAAYNDLAHLLDAQVRAGAWTDAETSLLGLFPFVATVGSGRTTHLLVDVVDRIRSSAEGSTLTGAAHALHEQLVAS